MDRNNKNSKNNAKAKNSGKNSNKSSSRRSTPKVMGFKLDITNVLLLVVVGLVIYFVFFDKNKIKFPRRLKGHSHKKEAFNNQGDVAVAGKTTLVLFHAEWCGYCKRFMPTWKKAKSTLQNNNVVLKDFEADDNADIMKANNVNGYPTLKLFKSDGEVVNYEGDRSLEDLQEFINENKK